ncbi:gliding motility protein SprC [Flavobacterium sp. KACC 22761]|uniref:gliding motility protein SprC n=1 Tax=Flavobacterium sp. KACC 22761 TaxID=3092665 RepID=UPI002A748A37|nr:gliding motility protein SprC [Flavobacterium sp. KACC 22761]WPO80057.1 gliding motility protein SprC [Flavobacterium sp. KACC 22761]
MIQKTTLSVIRFIAFFSILFCTETNTYAQTIVPQQLNFDRICAGLIIDGAPFNQYAATFSYVNFPAGTTFEVELSDDAGNFTTPTATTKISFTDDPTLQQQTIRFAVPTNLKGSDIYSLRVKSNTATPVYSLRFKNLANNTSFPAYYSTYVSAFYINEKSPTATICSGGSISLSVYNPTPNDVPSSPANYPNLKYKWYKDDVLIAGQSGTTLVVNSIGTYYAKLDYGLCSEDNLSSNRVTVTTSGSGSSVTISSSLGNPFCSSGSGTVLTATSGNSYVWKKNGTVISGATSRSYVTNEAGIYSVDVDFGGCKATGTIDLKGNNFTASLNVPATNVIAPNETLSVTVTTNAVNPTFEWYLGNTVIAGANTNTYLVSTKGNYKVKISQATGCIVEQELPFAVSYDSNPVTSVEKIANIISLSSYPYDVWDIPSEYKNPETSVKIISSNGDMVLDVVNYQGDWPPSGSIDIKNVNPVYYYVIHSQTGEKKGSITLIK